MKLDEQTYLLENDLPENLMCVRLDIMEADNVSVQFQSYLCTFHGVSQLLLWDSEDWLDDELKIYDRQKKLVVSFIFCNVIMALQHPATPPVYAYALAK